MIVYPTRLGRVLGKCLLLGCLLISGLAFSDERVELREGLFRVRHHPEATEMATASLQVLQDALVEYEEYLPVGEEPIYIIIAHTMDEFAEHGGWVDQISVSGMAFSGESLIVVKSPRLRMAGDDYAGTLRHELVHILLYRNVNMDYLPRWLNEGLAMRLAGDYRWGSVFGVAQLFLANQLIPYPELDRTFARRGHDGRYGDAYAQALSMTRFLHKELGEELFWETILATREMPFGEALRELTDMTALDFWHRYERSLWGYALAGMFSSGTLFIPAAFLVMVVWWKKQRQNRKVLDRWEAEEALLDGGPELGTWDDFVEDADAWKSGTEYEAEEDR